MKDTIIFTGDYIAYDSSAHTYTEAIVFADSDEINFRDITLFANYYVCWKA